MLTNEELERVVKKNLPRALFRHSLAVAKFSAQLGRRFGWNPDLAFRAGLLHDWAKPWSPRKLVKYIRANKVKVPGFQFGLKYAPAVLHSYAGAAEVKRRGWLNDPRAIRAVASHTMGRPGMSLPEKILYVADVASPDRTFSGAKGIYQTALKSLDLAYLASVALKISYVLCHGRPLHPLTLRVWNAALQIKARGVK